MEPKVIPRSQHSISRKDIDSDALKVLYRLHRAGFTAYMVGGGLRDILVGRKPKDFDICTSARPGEVRGLFRNSRTIGRRFRLVHVFFRDKIIEVSTFRRQAEFVEGVEAEADLLVRRENTFGTPEEDALRRDFTVNGLFYDIGTFSIIDFVGGLEDVRARVVKAIGDPDIRFREDPVRMLRAIKFSSRLGFRIEEATYNAILKFRQDILKCAKARVLEEIYRILGSGASAAAMALMLDCGMLDTLFPEIQAVMVNGKDGSEQECRKRLIGLLQHVDNLVHQGFPPETPVLLAVLFDPLIMRLKKTLPREGPVLQEGLESAIRPMLRRVIVSKKDQERLFQCLGAVGKFNTLRRRGFLPRSLVKKVYFPQAFALFSVYCLAHEEEPAKILKWHRRFLTEHSEGKRLQPGRAPGAGQPRGEGAAKSPRRRRPARKRQARVGQGKPSGTDPAKSFKRA